MPETHLSPRATALPGRTGSVDETVQAALVGRDRQALDAVPPLLQEGCSHGTGLSAIQVFPLARPLARVAPIHRQCPCGTTKWFLAFALHICNPSMSELTHVETCPRQNPPKSKPCGAPSCPGNPMPTPPRGKRLPARAVPALGSPCKER